MNSTILQPPPSSSSSLSSSSLTPPCPLHASAEKLAAVQKALSSIIHVEPTTLQDKEKTIATTSSNVTRVQVWPCASLEETIQYRCRCNFQLLYHETNQTFQYAIRQQQKPVPLLQSDNDNNQMFPMANRRIQRAMRGLLEFLHQPQRPQNAISKIATTNTTLLPGDESIKDEEEENENNDGFQFHAIRKNLTSVSFVSSWYDDDDDSDNSFNDPIPSSDCAITLHYDHFIRNNSQWQLQAQEICQRLHLVQLTGRSKGQVVMAQPHSTKTTPETFNAIRDVLWLHPPLCYGGHCDWKVRLGRCGQRPFGQHDKNHPVDSAPNINGSTYNDFGIPVYYYKHETAFCHPNARVMCRALEWMLNQIQHIVAFRRSSSTNTNEGTTTATTMDDHHKAAVTNSFPPLPPPLRLLELYSGNGAHTMALAKSGLLREICAVELDDRLVQACHVNLARNKLVDTPASFHTTTPATLGTTIEACVTNHQSVTDDSVETKKFWNTHVQVVQGDAGAWARKAQQILSGKAAKNCKESSTTNTSTASSTTTTTSSPQTFHPDQQQAFDILLVDPPRQGLDAAVCQWARHQANTVTDMLYISCGHEALVRDLTLLTSTTTTTAVTSKTCTNQARPFRVVDCQVLDLFPQTSAVETLVHLSRAPLNDQP